MNPIELQYLHKIQEITDNFTSKNKDDKRISSVLYASFLIDKLFVESPLEDIYCEERTIFEASIGLKLYRVLRDVEFKIIETFGEDSLVEELLKEVFAIVDFD